MLLTLCSDCLRKAVYMSVYKTETFRNALGEISISRNPILIHFYDRNNHCQKLSVLKVICLIYNKYYNKQRELKSNLRNRTLKAEKNFRYL